MNNARFPEGRRGDGADPLPENGEGGGRKGVAMPAARPGGCLLRAVDGARIQ